MLLNSLCMCAFVRVVGGCLDAQRFGDRAWALAGLALHATVPVAKVCNTSRSIVSCDRQSSAQLASFGAKFCRRRKGVEMKECRAKMAIKNSALGLVGLLHMHFSIPRMMMIDITMLPT